jgi:cytidine deaminase
MRNLIFRAKIRICNDKELNQTEKNLIDVAKEASFKAYAPYSGLKVGAAVLLANNEIISGNNQENAAYPLGLCAERIALFYANARFPDVAIEAIAVAACVNGDFLSEPITPCGGCRQVILEAQMRYNHPIRIILYGKRKIYFVEKITDLLPLNFSFHS